VLLPFSLSICWIFLYWVKVNVVPECESAKPHVDITANGLEVQIVGPLMGLVLTIEVQG
jgi:hypothetical protein